jgi:capsular polysaccharide transport system permease protein
MTEATRSSAQITFTTWKALFLREAVNRLSVGRAAWLWILLEPVTHIVFLLFIFTAVRMRTIGGIDSTIWLMVGMLSFFMFRRTATQSMHAIEANFSLFTYRQVRPVDTVLVRAALEGLLMVMVSMVLFAGVSLFKTDVAPSDPLAVLVAVFGLWLLGIGFGLIAAVLNDLVPEFGKVLGLAMTPLYFISGVIFPVASVPLPYREWMMLNPMANGLEAARLGFAPYYHAVPEMDVEYMYLCAMGMIFIGLALQVRYANRLVMR